MIALTLEEIEHVLVLIEYNLGARSYNEPYWHQADTIKSILQAEQRSLRQTVKGGEVQMAAKKKPVAKKPTAKKKAK